MILSVAAVAAALALFWPKIRSLGDSKPIEAEPSTANVILEGTPAVPEQFDDSTNSIATEAPKEVVDDLALDAADETAADVLAENLDDPRDLMLTNGSEEVTDHVAALAAVLPSALLRNVTAMGISSPWDKFVCRRRATVSPAR